MKNSFILKFLSMIIVFYACKFNSAFSGGLEIKLSPGDIPLHQISEAIEYYRKDLSGRICSLEVAREMEHVVHLYNILNFQTSEINDEKNDDLMYFVFYAKLSYIYEHANMPDEAKFNYYRAMIYGERFDKNLLNKDFFMKVIKRGKVGCIIKDDAVDNEKANQPSK